jgi:hypothetical protein
MDKTKLGLPSLTIMEVKRTLADFVKGLEPDSIVSEKAAEDEFIFFHPDNYAIEIRGPNSDYEAAARVAVGHYSMHKLGPLWEDCDLHGIERENIIRYFRRKFGTTKKGDAVLKMQGGDVYLLLQKESLDCIGKSHCDDEKNWRYHHFRVSDFVSGKKRPEDLQAAYSLMIGNPKILPVFVSTVFGWGRIPPNKFTMPRQNMKPPYRVSSGNQPNLFLEMKTLYCKSFDSEVEVYSVDH